MATGTTAFTYDEGTDGLGQHTNCKQVIFNWTSTSGGAAAGTARKIVGKLIKAVVIPSATSAPTNGYSVTITDGNSVNVLANSKANLSSNSNVTTKETYFFIVDTSATPVTQASPPVVCDLLTFTVASAGNATSGTVIVYYEVM